MLLFTFLLIPNIIASPIKTIGDYSVTIVNNTLTNVVPGTSTNKALNKNLNLSGLHISSIDKGAFDNVPEIESLDLSKNDISILHRGVFTPLRKLKHLLLANNRLEDFHKAFEGLKNLESLDISNTRVTDLGKSDFLGIPKSTVINTSGDKIETISRALFAQSHANEFARAILCQREGIVTSLRYQGKPKPLVLGCTSVQIDPGYPHWVRLNRSGIIGFDRNWYQLYNTEIDGLDLSGNNIADITSNFVNALPRHLKYIDLSNNKIERVNERSLVHINLEWLYLSNNLISKIENDAFKVTNLQGLKLDGNRLKDSRFVATLPSGLLRLNLRNNQLSELQLAQSFSTLRALTHLNLGENHITELKSEHLFGLKSLTNLDLQRNGLKKIHSYSFDRVTKLKKLILSNNRLTDLEYYLFFVSIDIEILDLSHNNLTILPRFLFSQLKRLKYLYLGYNGLTSLNRAFVGLSDLNLLDFSYNRIASAEKEDFIGVPTTVTILSDGNAISSTTIKDKLSELTLPDESEGGPPILLCMRNGIVKAVRRMTKEDAPIPKYCQKIKLVQGLVMGLAETVLHLRSYLISGFAKKWYRLDEPISTIVLDKNKIVRVTSEMLNDLPDSVKYVYVRDNKIKRLKKGVIVNRHLRILRLDGNQIREMEENALINTNLEEVGIPNNSIEGVKFVAGMPLGLKHLDASGNVLEAIKAGTFSRLNKLTTLHLKSAYITNIEPQSFRGLSSLNILSLANNKLKTIDKDVFQHTKSLEKLNLEMNQLQSLDKLLFHGLANLTDVNLQFNQFHNITKKTFPHFPDSLQSLDLRDNGMIQIEPESFVGGLKYELLLHGNHLKTIDKGIFNLPDLVRLDLSDNQLTRLNGESFENLPNLEELYLNENSITGIDKGAAKYLNNLYMLDLSDNPITALGNGAFYGLSNLPDQQFEAVIRVEDTPIKHISGDLFDDEH